MSQLLNIQNIRSRFDLPKSVTGKTFARLAETFTEFAEADCVDGNSLYNGEDIARFMRRPFARELLITATEEPKRRMTEVERMREVAANWSRVRSEKLAARSAAQTASPPTWSDN